MLKFAKHESFSGCEGCKYGSKHDIIICTFIIHIIHSYLHMYVYTCISPFTTYIVCFVER